MPKGVVFNGSNDITYLIGDGESTDSFLNRVDVLMSPDFSPVISIPDFRKWRKNGNVLELKTQGERDAIDSSDAADVTALKRTIAAAIKDISNANGVQWRAFALVLLDEINNLRQWDASLKTAFANNSTLATIRTAVAALPATADRTIAQVKTAYQNKIDTGSAD